MQRSPIAVEHSGRGIYGCHSHNAKLWERIEHSGKVLKCKQTKATT